MVVCTGASVPTVEGPAGLEVVMGVVMVVDVCVNL
jgi:hypothetical protein